MISAWIKHNHNQWTLNAFLFVDLRIIIKIFSEMLLEVLYCVHNLSEKQDYS